MNPTEADYEKLARTLCEARGEDPDSTFSTLAGDVPLWTSEAIDEDNDLVIATRDTLDDFQANSPNWSEPGIMQEVAGGLYWERCRASKGQDRCELCIVDCGEFRLTFQC